MIRKDVMELHIEKTMKIAKTDIDRAIHRMDILALTTMTWEQGIVWQKTLNKLMDMSR